MQDLRRLLTYLRPHWDKFTLATVAMLAGALLQSAINALVVPIFDQALGGTHGTGQHSKTLSARHAATEFHARRLPRGFILLLLATHTRLAPHRADHCVAHHQLRTLSAQPCARCLRRQSTACGHSAGSTRQSDHRQSLSG